MFRPRSYGLAVVLVLVGLPGCADTGTNQSDSGLPPLDHGFEAQYAMQTSTGERHVTMRVGQWRDQLGMHGEKAPCLEVVFRERIQGSEAHVCYAGGTMEPVRGTLLFSEERFSDELQFPDSLNHISLEAQFGMALSLLGKDWEPGQKFETTWYGVPIEWNAATSNDRLLFDGTVKLYDSEGTEVPRTIKLAFEKGMIAPLDVGSLLRYESGYKMGEVLEVGLPITDWNKVADRLESYSFPWPTGASCSKDELTPQEAFDYAAAQDADVEAVRGGFVAQLRYLWHNLTANAAHVKEMDMSITKGDSDVRFTVRKTQGPLGPPVMEYIKSGNPRHHLESAQYPPTLIPFCRALEQMRTLVGPETYLRIDPGGLDYSTFDGSKRMRLSRTTTWGSDGVAIVIKAETGNGAQPCWLGATTALLIECLPNR